MMRLKGEVAVLTAAAMGISLASARQFGHEAAWVAVCGVQADAVHAAVADCRKAASKRTGTPAKVMRRLRDDVPLERLVRTEEVANSCAFPARGEAGCINGAVVGAAGGTTV